MGCRGAGLDGMERSGMRMERGGVVKVQRSKFARACKTSKC